ncbi:cache domain-containing protein [Fangia hongkongensis]|uniref:cache domain-containing protein n=1 Tax=Fangia hongkongensis TaxID=270495 RepID=UPI0012B601CC|nr:cache domain-containing protein [Fangia hongkongensis]MBK2124531.1 cache domain-containing protein [Fangia hongkongensis]
MKKIKRLYLYTSLFFMLSLICVYFVLFIPTYTEIKAQKSKALNYTLQSTSLILKHYLSSITSTSAQIASRTKAKDLTESYITQKKSINEITPMLEKILTAALDSSESLKGITRISQSGQRIVSVGQAIPNLNHWYKKSKNLEHSKVLSVIYMSGKRYLLLYMPIKNTAFSQIMSSDLALFSVSQLYAELKNIAIQRESTIGIYMSNGKMSRLYSTDDKLFNIKAPNIKQGRQGEIESQVIMLDNQSYILSHLAIKNTPWVLVTLVSSSTMYGELQWIFYFNVVVLIAIFLLFIAGLYVLFIKVNK